MNIEFIAGRLQAGTFPRRAQRGGSDFPRGSEPPLGADRPKRLGLWLLVVALLSSPGLLANGNWLKCGFTAPGAIGFTILLSDGTVMALNYPPLGGGTGGPIWFKLTPDPNGHYVNGEWSQIASMHYPRQAFGSQVLPDGRVLVIGGEHPNGGPQEASAEIYEPGGDFWTLVDPPSSLLDRTQNSPDFGGPFPNKAQGFIDCPSVLLRNGTVLIAPVAPALYNGTLIYDPKANSWANGPATTNHTGETSWLKLPDGSILSVGTATNATERYIPALNQWIPDADVPVNLWGALPDPFPPEMGPALLLPNGNGFFLGGSGKTAIYRPSGGINQGSWLPGPDIPDGRVSADAPAAMLPNGKILCAVSGPPLSSLNSDGEPQFTTPTSFYEYDYSEGPVGAFHQVDGPTGKTDDIISQNARMLVLPDGSVLYCHTGAFGSLHSSDDDQLYVYVPSDGVPVATKPVIYSITPNSDGTFILEGTGLSGLSAGAAFGDDAQMDGNYPIIMFTDTASVGPHVDYGRSFDWSDSGVMTGNETETVKFSLPPGLAQKDYKVSVSVNGIISDPVDFSFVQPQFLALCPGESGTLQLVTAPDPSFYYYWKFYPTGFEDGGALPGETNAVLNIVSAQTNQTGYYALGWLYKNDVLSSPLIPVAVGVWIVEQPPATNSTAICQPFSISVHARGKGTLKAQWLRNGHVMPSDPRITFSSQPGLLPGETVLSMHISETKYEDDATYTVLISDDCTQGRTLPFALRVTPNPPWVRIATDGPAPRDHAAMCYDSDRHVTVLFGGSTTPNSPPSASGFFGDTWEFDGTNWTQRQPVNSPGPRTFANLAYDSWRHRSVLFGGYRLNRAAQGQTEVTLETWEWDGTNWQQIVTDHVPPLQDASFPYPTCFDSVRGEVLLFGYMQDPLWAYDGTDWQVRNAGGAGPKYNGSAPYMAFDANRGVAVLAGAPAAMFGNTRNESVWEWDGKWHEIPQSGQQPDLIEIENAFTYDTFRQECVLFGKESGSVDGLSTSAFYPAPDLFRLVWRWNGAQWQADPPTPTLGVSWQWGHSMCFDTARNALVLFGGYGEGNTNVMNYTYEIVYKDAPVVLKQPTFQYATLGLDTQITVVAGGAPALSYQWQKDGVNLTDTSRISGATSNILQITGVKASDFGQYQLAMSNACGSTNSEPIQLRVALAPIAVALSTGALSMAWSDPAATLQTATNPAGPWTPVPTATPSYTVVPNAVRGFFRLIH